MFKKAIVKEEKKLIQKMEEVHLVVAFLLMHPL